MSETNEFHADEVRAAARRIQALPDDTDRIPDRIAEATRRAADANPGFASASGLVDIAEEYRLSVTGLGERLTDQAELILRAVEARESGDEAAAAEFDRIDPPS
ncbi:hypothetical protein [Glycomyces tenuis]|uniref:hypothetical protein n=1 Tax=Glycomyces tenuis TaxID=58116 RepID=UPI0004083CFB|nr:hypothetical protein [Glycomyces tenuis]